MGPTQKKGAPPPQIPRKTINLHRSQNQSYYSQRDAVEDTSNAAEKTCLCTLVAPIVAVRWSQTEEVKITVTWRLWFTLSSMQLRHWFFGLFGL